MQFFLQAKLLGIEAFVQAAPSAADCAGRSLYTTLVSEILPRALLHSAGLAKELVGLSGGGHFLVVLPRESIPQANEFLTAAAGRLQALSAGELRLIWNSTENLGDWSIARKRLFEPLDQMQRAPGYQADVPDTPPPDFAESFFAKAVLAKTAGWDPENPFMVVLDGGVAAWTISPDLAPDTISVASHFARGEETEAPAQPGELAGRARGRKLWGVLRGDVDNFGVRLRRAQSIEEHIQLSVFLKQFFAGELQVVCSMGEFWRKVSILYTGGDDFAVYGAWDALIPLAREVQRLFHKSAEEFLRDLPGPEGKTISMAVALAPEGGASLSTVLKDASRELEAAKSLGKDSISVFGRVVEWKQLAEASELRDNMVRLLDEFGCSPEFLGQLGGFYRDTAANTMLRLNRAKAERFDRPWRFYRRLNRVLEGPVRNREFQKARAGLLGEFIGKNQAHVKLRPSGRVALEWARLMQEAK